LTILLKSVYFGYNPYQERRRE